jgi:phosphoglycerol transferase
MISLQDQPTLDESRRDGLRSTITPYILAGVLCLVAEFLLFNLWKADLSVPFYYPIGSDLLHNLMLTKNVTETGWLLTYPRLGAPGILEHHDYTTLEYLHCYLLKIVAWFARDFGLTINLFYLLSFPLITWTSLFAMTRLGISRPVAVVASLLYAFAPYHFLRGQYHFFLAAYFAIPLLVLLLVRICQGKPLFFGWGPRGVRWPVAAFTALTCAVVAGSGVYSAFFGLYFVGVAALIGYSRRWQRARLADGLSVMALIFGLLLIEAMPSLLYSRAHGKNPAALRRDAWESEEFALSFSSMFRPAPYHRFKSLAKVAMGRGETAWPGNLREFINGDEKHFATLGMFGACGLVVLLALPFVVRKPASTPTLLDPLSKLCLAGVLLGVPGGIGNLVAIYLTANFRALNRVSIYIAYFCVLAAALLLDLLRRKAVASGHRWRFDAALGALLVICLLDQMPGFLIPDYDRANAVFARDREFFRRVEAALPADSMVFVLPYAEFPDGYTTARKVVWSYRSDEHIRPFLHTDRLRFSIPTMRGREWDRWQARLWKEPTDRVVAELIRAGFRGISIDREGYDDRADQTIADLRRILGTDPIESPDQRFAFFSLPPADPPAVAAGSK